MNQLKEAIQAETKRFEEIYLWLEKSMPKIFFSEVNFEKISLIVHSLMGFKVQDFFTEIHLKESAIALTLESPEADVDILQSYGMHGIKNYTTYVSKNPLPFPETKHALLRIAIIYFAEHAPKEKESFPEEQKKALLKALAAQAQEMKPNQAEALFNKMDARFLRAMPLERQVIALEMFHRAHTRDLCQYEVEYDKEWQKNGSFSMHITLAWKNTPKHNFLYRLAKVVYQHNLMMHRVNAAYINPYQKEGIFMLSFSLHGNKGQAAHEATDISDFLKELVSLKYFGSDDIFEETFVKENLLRGNLANLLRTIRYFIHQALSSIDPNLYNLANIEEGLSHHPELTLKLLNSFETKFHPQKSDITQFETLKKEYLALVGALDTGDEYQDRRRKNILLQAMNFVTYTLKTNFYKNNKAAFAFRLDPKFLDELPFDRKKLFPEMPYGIFFIKGMHFFGFHIRFKDLSRGGLRTVFPEKKEKVTSEMNTVLQECYNLAYTQHKKNKDIPEGGAKGVIFLKPDEHLEEEAAIFATELKEAGFTKEKIEKKIEEFKKEQKLEYLYQTQRAYILSFLSIINCNPDGTLRAKDIVDYWKKPEYIYLGPDENLHDVMIEWIAEESKREGYKPGGAFISGKPTVGINHKEYGVTSLGCTVYMHEVLHFLGIDPNKESFTVKITGGPDGDVGGNMLLNLFRFYRKTAIVVALTDVSGTINDPQGLDLDECVRLFKEGKPISFYSPQKLHEGGFLLDKEKKKEITPYLFQTLLWKNEKGKLVSEWISGSEMNHLYRNNVHETYADIFIPCGGRPRTLRDTNCHEFLDKAKKPTSRAIVEGANLYLTQGARRFLEERGVIIIKDSSANKGGVITSSFEILAGLVLRDEEFLALKPKLVDEILERVKKCSHEEAVLLLKTHTQTKQFLTDISEEISARINLYTDQLLTYLEPLTLSHDPHDPLIAAFLSYVPTTLKQKYEKRLLTELPDNHKKAIIATSIAARLVYKRGLSWSPTLVDILPLVIKDVLGH